MSVITAALSENTYDGIKTLTKHQITFTALKQMAGLHWVRPGVDGKTLDAASITAMILWYEPERGKMGPKVFL